MTIECATHATADTFDLGKRRVVARDLTTSIAQEVDSLRRMSLPLDSVRSRIDLSRFRERFAGRDRLRNDRVGYYVISSAIPKAFADGAVADRVTPPQSR